MGKPWEEYQNKAPSNGPWDDYKKPSEEMGFLESASRAIDSYTGAPARKAIGTLQEGKGLGSALSEGLNQFGENPDLAPSGKQIAVKAGIPDKQIQYRGGMTFSPADVLGFGVELGADVTNVLPVAKIAKGAGYLAEKGIQGISKLSKPIAAAENVAGNVIKKGVVTGLFGVPEDAVNNYLKNHPVLKDKVGARAMMEEVAGNLESGLKPYRDNILNLENAVKKAKEQRTENLSELLVKKSEATENLKLAQEQALGEAASIVSNRVKELDKGVRAGSERAYKILDEEGVRAPLTPIKSDLTKGINLLSQEAVTDTQVAVVELLQRYRDRFDKLGKDISGGQAKRLIQSLDSEISRLAPGEIGRLSKPDQVLGILRQRIDEPLKKNVNYANQMVQVADDTKLLMQVKNLASESDAVRALQASKKASGKDQMLLIQSLENKFGDNVLRSVERSNLPEYSQLKGIIQKYRAAKKGYGVKGADAALEKANTAVGDASNLVNSDVAKIVDNINSFIRSSQPRATQTQALNKAGELAGINMGDELQSIKTIGSFEKGYNRGSANTNFWGAVVGGLTGAVMGPAGMLGGAALGGAFGKSMIDNFGPAIGRKILDQVPNLQKMKPSKWIQSLDVPKAVKMKLEDDLALYQAQTKFKQANLLSKPFRMNDNKEKK